MAFPKTPQKTPAKVGRVAITIGQTVNADGALAAPDATISYDVLDANGSVVETKAVPLLNELTTAQRTALTGLLTAMRDRLNVEVV